MMTYGVNFRATAGYVTDGTGYTYCAADVYPTTRGGTTFGWSGAGALSPLTADRDNTNAAQLAGINYLGFFDPIDTFRIDLPATGAYDIHYAGGDAASGNKIYGAFYDNATLLGSVSSSGLSSNNFLDAVGNSWSAAGWPGSNVALSHTFTSTIFNLLVDNQGSGFPVTASVALISSGGGTHPSTGALTGQGSTIAGSAKRFRAHPSIGALTGPGSTIAGTAVHKTKHVTSGALVGPGAVIVGTAAHWHKTSGALIGQGSTVAGVAVHYTKHTTSGVLMGPGAAISGTAAHTASVHTTTGALIGPGAIIAGTAMHISTAVTVLAPTRGGLPPTKKDRDRYLARERLLDEIRAERVRAKRLENDELEQQLTQLFVQVPDVTEPAPAQPKPLKRSAKKQREAVQPAMDFQPILAKLAEIKIELQKFEEDEDDIAALLLL